MKAKVGSFFVAVMTLISCTSISTKTPDLKRGPTQAPEELVSFPYNNYVSWASADNRISAFEKKHNKHSQAQASLLDPSQTSSCITRKQAPAKIDSTDVEAEFDGEACPEPSSSPKEALVQAQPMEGSSFTPDQLRRMRSALIEARDKLTTPLKEKGHLEKAPASATEARKNLRAYYPKHLRDSQLKANFIPQMHRSLPFWERKDEGKDTSMRVQSDKKMSSKMTSQGHMEYYYSVYLPFYPEDYVDYLDYKFYTFYAPSGADYITVDFDYMDLESFDHVYLYDRYGLCGSYTGYHGSFLSNTCEGNYVDVWIKTDSSGNGTSYDGFAIAGFYYGYSSPPVAVAAASKYFAKTNEVITFDHSNSYDIDYDIYAFYWDFGDGQSTGPIGLNAPMPIHTYPNPGHYLVTLRVEDRMGNNSYDQFWLEVTQTPPQIHSYLLAETVEKKNPVRVVIIKDNVEPISKLEIDWGDQSITTVKNYSGYETPFEHQYANAGHYLVVVKAKNSGGNATNSLNVEVTDLPIKPSLWLTNLSNIQNSQENVGYKVTPKYGFADDGNITQITVDFGAGPGSVQSSPRNDIGYIEKKFQYIYQIPLSGKSSVKKVAGVYNITAEVSDNSNLNTQSQFTFTTRNQAPQPKKKARKENCVTVQKPNCSGASGENCSATQCHFVYGKGSEDPNNLSLLFSDPDGSVVDFYWEFYQGKNLASLQSVPECPRQAGLSADCVFSTPGTYFARFSIVDNLGKSKDKFLKLKIK